MISLILESKKKKEKEMEKHNKIEIGVISTETKQVVAKSEGVGEEGD